MFKNITWNNIKHDSSIELFEHPIYNCFIHKTEFEKEFQELDVKEFMNKKLKNTLRILFISETIGSIAYISKNLKNLKNNIIGGYIETFLLEKIRVIRQNPNERNFHIFYEILNGLADKSKALININ